jgi:hypothetical protein
MYRDQSRRRAVLRHVSVNGQAHDFLDGFSKGWKVRMAEADDTFRRLDPEVRLQLYST